jgi:hypothetical protein
MIREKGIYEAVDERKGIPDPIEDIVVIESIPGGFEVRSYRGIGKQFQLENDDQFEDSETITTFHMPEGKIHFVELTLSDFERLEGKSVYGTPDFKTQKEMHDWFRSAINANWGLD